MNVPGVPRLVPSVFPVYVLENKRCSQCSQSRPRTGYVCADFVYRFQTYWEHWEQWEQGY
jgi:hypothetical protein